MRQTLLAEFIVTDHPFLFIHYVFLAFQNSNFSTSLELLGLAPNKIGETRPVNFYLKQPGII